MSILQLSLIAAVVAVVLLLVFVIAITLRRVVPTNMVHIVQTSHSSTPYGRGKPAGNAYYAWPSWLPKLGITVTEFPESIFQVALNDYEAYAPQYSLAMRAYGNVLLKKRAAQLG
ncbi:hypothetical protein [Herbaspirillum frisingense]|uniref:hypothetical protein n=1 Tax=Herbaspirillum frisingense TaxID=92645 RepID=UPI001F28FFFA|nr:hypothetical protein [Herbaspirillum frisingense]UIN20701.1 hypothetical protein LAZ82_19865 [Herbaspirillum frisingense]